MAEKTPRTPDDPTDKGPASSVPNGPPSGKAVPVPTPVQPEGSDPDIDLGKLDSSPTGSGSSLRSQGSGPLSGTSIVSWSDLVKAQADEEARISMDSQDYIDLDASSDQDLLKKVLADEPPSGELHIPGPVMTDDSAEQSALPSSRHRRGSVEDSILNAEEGQEQSSSVFAGSEPKKSGDSSDVNFLNSDPVNYSSSEMLNRTDDGASPVYLSPSDDESTAEIGDMPQQNLESSAVDLGSQSVIDLPFPLAIDSKTSLSESGVRRARSGRSTGDSGTVDLLAGAKNTGLSSLPGLTQVGSSMRPDSDLPSTARVDIARARTPSWVSGIIGGLTGVAICTGVWLSGALTPSTKPQPSGNAPVVLTGLNAGLAKLDSGDLDQAVDLLDKVEKSPDVQTTLGQVRVLRYLKQCAQSNAKPLAAADDIKAALQDFQQAATPTAQLWQGLTQEAVGKVAEARNIYTEALGSMPEHKKLFQAALDRLDTRPTAAPAGKQAKATLDLGVFTLLVQLGDANLPEEPGFEFWKAVRLAKAHRYAEAIAALKLAKENHDARRMLLLHKGLNPISDPLEESFIRACDELSAYWKLREQLHTGGYKLDGYPSPSSAVASLLTNVKRNADETKALQKTFTTVRDAVAQAKLDPNDLVVAFNSLVKAKATADAETARAKAEATSANTAKEAAESAMQTAKDALTVTDEGKKKAEAELQKVKEQMAAMKTGAGDPMEVVNLKAEREKLQARAKELEDQLAESKVGGENARKTARDLGNFLIAVRQKLQAPATTPPADVLSELDKALAVKPAPPAGLPPELPASYAVDGRAEREFHAGLVNLRNGILVEAERRFQQAVKLNDKDARYWYYLGLVRLNLPGKNEQGQQDLQQGWEREKRNLPNASAIDACLERLPADARRVLEQARGRG